MLKKYVLVGLVIVALVLSGCSDDKKETSKEKHDKKSSARKAKTAATFAQEFCDKVDTRFFWGDNGMTDYQDTVVKVINRLNETGKKYKVIKTLLLEVYKNEPDETRKVKIAAMISDIDDIQKVLPEFTKLTSDDYAARGIVTLDDAVPGQDATQEELKKLFLGTKEFIAATGPLIKTYNENEEHFWLNMSAVFPYSCLKDDPVRPGGLLPHHLEQEVQSVD